MLTDYSSTPTKVPPPGFKDYIRLNKVSYGSKSGGG